MSYSLQITTIEVDNLFQESQQVLQRPSIYEFYKGTGTGRLDHSELILCKLYMWIRRSQTRHRRSRSTGEKWIEHRAPNPVPLGTILHPYLKNRKSITKTNGYSLSTKSKHFKLLSYLSRIADTDDVETKLCKVHLIM